MHWAPEDWPRFSHRSFGCGPRGMLVPSSPSPLGWALVYFAFALLLIGLLGACRLRVLQALLANVAVIVPANVVLTVAYLVLTPVRYFVDAHDAPS